MLPNLVSEEIVKEGYFILLRSKNDELGDGFQLLRIMSLKRGEQIILIFFRI